jgi:maleate isomerase
MTDVLGYRAVLGVLGPSTNTVVQPEMEAMRPAGVTNHYSRITVQNPKAMSDESFMAGTLEIDKNTMNAVHSIMTCAPDHLVMGMSAVTFYGGASQAKKWKETIESEAGIKASMGSESLVAALNAYGGIKKVAFLSPYYPVANREVSRYLGDYGYDTVRDVPLRCETWLHIAQVTNARLREVVADLDGDDVDAIVQVGTNLSMVTLAARLEQSLAKPVIAINTATYWHALRSCGIEDKICGFGRLLEEY